DAYAFEVMLRTCLGNACPRSEADRLLEAGLKRDASEDGLFIEMALYLLPRWYGTPEEVVRLAESAAIRSRSHLNDIAYVRVAGVPLLTEGEPFPQAYPGFSWLRIKEGLRQLEEQYPRSARNANLAARFACAYRDRDMARVFLGAFGAVWDADAE